MKVQSVFKYSAFSAEFKLNDIPKKIIDRDSNLIKGEGTIIAINEKPNIDVDLSINNFDIDFIERIGLNTMSNISSKVSGEINLWGSIDNIQHNGKLFLNESSFIIPYLNIEYLLSDNSEITLFNQNFEITSEVISKFTPHELGYHLSTRIDFEKGCYTGQEIVARMHYRAKKLPEIIVRSTNKEVEDLTNVYDKDNKVVGLILSCTKTDSNYHCLLSMNKNYSGQELDF